MCSSDEEISEFRIGENCREIISLIVLRIETSLVTLKCLTASFLFIDTFFRRHSPNIVVYFYFVEKKIKRLHKKISLGIFNTPEEKNDKIAKVEILLKHF